VDSTLLLKAAKDVLHDDVLAVTAQSETTPRHEMKDACRLAEELRCKHLIVQGRELDLEDFTRNPPDKCYICKKSRFGHLVQLAEAQGLAFVVDGENSDDETDYRPGSKAARELGVRSPLREAGFSKEEIRSLSKKLGLSTWNKPSYACLASRIPYGHPITAQKLRQIDAAEDFIRKFRVSDQLRVRHHGDTARIEVDAEAMWALLQSPIRGQIVRSLKHMGFDFVTLDLEGYETGSLNRSLHIEDQQSGWPEQASCTQVFPK
jgi:uncharacterized protein